MRADTADHRSLVVIDTAETRWSRSGFGEEVGVASSSIGLSLVGSSTNVLGCVYSSASTGGLVSSLGMGGSGGR